MRKPSRFLPARKVLVALEGWIETSQVASLRDFLQEGFGSRVLLETRDVTEKDWDDVPIQLRNNALVEPFELVTEMYALPKYYEKDPTPIVSLFYFCFLWHDGRRYRLWTVANGGDRLCP